MVELLDFVHEATGQRPYVRALVMHWFNKAFGLGPRDFSTMLFACELFGDGATASLDQTERAFWTRLAELGFRRVT